MEKGKIMDLEVENPMITGEGLPEEPQEEEILFSCDLCHQEIYEGDSYIYYAGDIFCSSHHLGEHLLNHGLAETRIAKRKVFH
ncbi:hypothetical protein ACFOZY_04905 [Chungangia koreensis]|uniref:Uncharacterized protein n=1 Tax=Chungangia koreensis TaxID=752657 RepID=A0ABV8X3P0_9LACT